MDILWIIRLKTRRILRKDAEKTALIQPPNRMRDDLGVFPDYLYDDNFFNDFRYIFSRAVYLSRVSGMRADARKGIAGITSFDDYSNWMANFSFGVNSIYKIPTVDLSFSGEPQHLSENEIKLVRENVRQNLLSLPIAYPNTVFLYCVSPYSAAWWQMENESGGIYRYIEAQEIACEEMMKYDNIRLFSYANMIEMTSDLNNYKDTTHYGEWINSLLLQWMFENLGLLTADNYKEYLARQTEIYRNFDYQSLLSQVDYENDYMAAGKKYYPEN